MPPAISSRAANWSIILYIIWSGWQINDSQWTGVFHLVTKGCRTIFWSRLGYCFISTLVIYSLQRDHYKDCWKIALIFNQPDDIGIIYGKFDNQRVIQTVSEAFYRQHRPRDQFHDPVSSVKCETFSRTCTYYSLASAYNIVSVCRPRTEKSVAVFVFYSFESHKCMNVRVFMPIMFQLALA